MRQTLRHRIVRHRLTLGVILAKLCGRLCGKTRKTDPKRPVAAKVAANESRKWPQTRVAVGPESAAKLAANHAISEKVAVGRSR